MIALPMSQVQHVQQEIPVVPSRRFERTATQDPTLQKLGVGDLGPALQINPYGHRDRGAASLPSQPAQPVTAAPVQPPKLSDGAHKQHKSRPPSAPVLTKAIKPSAASPLKPMKPQGVPIILVPPGLTAKINMFNAKVRDLPARPTDHAEVRLFKCTSDPGHFYTKCCNGSTWAVGAQTILEDGQFKRWETCKEEGVKKQNLLVVRRSIGRKQPVVYHVMDHAPDKKTDWQRVVAVFVSGQAWQFKGWPYSVRLLLSRNGHCKLCRDFCMKLTCRARNKGTWLRHLARCLVFTYTTKTSNQHQL